MNWLADSTPDFPAQISEILYAQSYATRCEGHSFGICALKSTGSEVSEADGELSRLVVRTSPQPL
jgi:hypothetical protein